MKILQKIMDNRISPFESEDVMSAEIVAIFTFYVFNVKLTPRKQNNRVIMGSSKAKGKVRIRVLHRIHLPFIFLYLYF